MLIDICRLFAFTQTPKQQRPRTARASRPVLSVAKRSRPKELGLVNEPWSHSLIFWVLLEASAYEKKSKKTVHFDVPEEKKASKNEVKVAAVQDGATVGRRMLHADAVDMDMFFGTTGAQAGKRKPTARNKTAAADEKANTTGWFCGQRTHDTHTHAGQGIKTTDADAICVRQVHRSSEGRYWQGTIKYLESRPETVSVLVGLVFFLFHMFFPKQWVPRTEVEKQFTTQEGASYRGSVRPPPLSERYSANKLWTFVAPSDFDARRDVLNGSLCFKQDAGRRVFVWWKPW